MGLGFDLLLLNALNQPGLEKAERRRIIARKNAWNKLLSYKRSDGLYDIRRYITENPKDMQTLKDAGYSQNDITFIKTGKDITGGGLIELEQNRQDLIDNANRLTKDKLVYFAPEWITQKTKHLHKIENRPRIGRMMPRITPPRPRIGR